MTATIIDGKALANDKLEKLAKEIEVSDLKLCLAVVLMGDDPASKTYIHNKQAACECVGITSKLYELDAQTSETELLNLIHTLNEEENVHGILVQLPLPAHIKVSNVINAVSPKKDVDGFHPDTKLPACTAQAIMELLNLSQVKLKNKTAVVVGQSMIVGKPTAKALALAGCDVICCDKSTEDLSNEVRKADILVVAVGKPHLIKGEWIKDGAVVIDVGINRLANNHIVGDVEFETAKKRASLITPVPGGVGPMTVAVLMQNTLLAAILN